MTLHPITEQIMAAYLGEPLRTASADLKAHGISTAEYNRCAEAVEGLVRAGLSGHAEQHARAVRFNLGAPWDNVGQASVLGGAA